MSKELAKQKIVLLDAHAILHRAYHALPDFASATGEPTGALYGLSAMLLRIINELKPDYIAAAYDLPKPTYRHIVYENYKAGRAKTEDSLTHQIGRSRDVLRAFSIPIYECEGFEADDVLGTIVEQVKGRKNIETIIASGDMDTLQLVDGNTVQVFTLKKGIQDTVLYNEDAVRERFGFGPELMPDYKGLRGDPSDNIPGVRGIGEKTATTLITQIGSLEKIYAQLKKNPGKIEKAGITKRIVELLKANEEEAEFSKMLATIRRDVPIEFIIPKKKWKDEVDTEAVSALFQELGFRSLVDRAKDFFKTNTASVQKEPAVPEREPTENEVRETAIALWLLNSEMANPTETDIKGYVASGDFFEAKDQIFKDLQEQGLDIVFETIEKPLMPILSMMKQRGIQLDVVYLKGLSDEYHTLLSACEKRVWSEAGGEFNINSPRQMAEVLYEKLGLKGKKKTATGQRSTREGELIKLKDAHPIIEEILNYRELQKLLSTYIDAFPKMVGPDGRLHTSFIQTGTATGRLSSQSPNLQNIPIRSDLGRAVRGAFIAQKGYSLLALDYSQIELRIAAILSKDKKLTETFKNGGDVHTAVASEMFNVPVESVTGEMRRTAKVINFGILYGMGANALAQTGGISREAAQEYLAQYVAAFPELLSYFENIKREARTKGYTKTLFGRKRFFPGLNSKLPYLQAEAERQAVNAPIQGTNADIVKLAMIKADEYLTEHDLQDGIRLVLQIHDELIYEVKNDMVEMAASLLKEIMESIIPKNIRQDIPIVVEAARGERWSTLQKIQF